MPVQERDTVLGAWVYCKSHIRPHETGWCPVNNRWKIPLSATTYEEAFEEVKALRLPISGHCVECYRWVGPGHPAKNPCPEHDDD